METRLLPKSDNRATLKAPELRSQPTSNQQPYRPPQPRFVPIVINGKLAFKFDPERGLIEWQHRGERFVIDLGQYGGPEGERKAQASAERV